jgi:ADP-ribose pyrophosphatase YjhB (NUDIX family)
MIINAYGVLNDHLNRVLLQRRVGSETLGPPGRMVAHGQLPADGVAAAFREETGLIVLPLRLTGVYFQPDKDDTLSFCFRCLLRGGQLAVPRGQPEAGFFDSQPLPEPMLSLHQQQVRQALQHSGGKPHWELQARSLSSRFRSWLAREGDSAPSPQWEVTATAAARNSSGQLLWVRRPSEGGWQLPEAKRHAHEAPWDTARRALEDVLGAAPPLSDLALVLIGEGRREMGFVFLAGGAAVPPATSEDVAYFSSGTEPAESRPQHVALAAELLRPAVETRFLLQVG